MLKCLSGTTHRVYTGVALIDIDRKRMRVTHALSLVKMKEIPEIILQRLARKNQDKAGSYAIQSKNDPIARVVRGDYDTVVGLPLRVVKRLLAPYRLPKT